MYDCIIAIHHNHTISQSSNHTINMGLFNFIKDELIEVIDWVESGGDVIVWKFPDKDCNIKYGAQLTVRESQVAMMLDEGKFADMYQPGMHTLITDNMPLLTSLRNWKTGFKSPFLADVYFVSTRQFTNLKWGTPNPIILRDPEFKQVRVKAFGTYFIQVKDPKKMFTSFAGTAKQLSVRDIEARMRDIIAPKFAEALAEAQVSVLDMASNYTELGDKIRPMIQAEFEPFGIELTKFQVTSTSLPKEVEEFYDKMTNMHMVGDDMAKFTQFQSANAIEKAAENPGGSGEAIGAGIGIGMGSMMANQLQQSQQQLNQQNQPPPAPKAETKEDIMNMLKDLGGLKEAGILTQKEFDAKKKELLARL